MTGISPEQTVGIFYKTRVRDVMTQAMVTCDEDARVTDMANQMRDHGIGSVVVVDSENRPRGIVTERDLVYKVVAAGCPGDLTAYDIMSSPPVVTQPDDFIYQALHLMTRRHCRRLIVVNNRGEVSGFLSMRDIMRLEASDSRMLLERIAKAGSIEELSAVRRDIDEFVHRLFIGDVDGRALSEIMTDFNETVTRRIISLNEMRLRAEGFKTPLTGYAWVAFGSEGRKEQVLRGDQDNGLVLPDDSPPEAIAYYLKLAQRINLDLAGYGFELCKGGVMAREEKYFGTLAQWKARARHMIRNSSEGRELRDLSILLDLKHVTGDEGLVDDLWAYMLAELQNDPPALRALAEDGATKPVPLTLLGRLRYEKDDQGRRGINVKRYGVLPLTAGVKALSMEREVRPTSTPERIQALRDQGVLERNTAADLLFAHELLLRLKLQASIEKVIHGQTATHFFYPEDWTDWERHNLKRAFKAIDRLLSFLRLHFAL